MLDPIRKRHAAHGFCNFPGLWTVVNVWKDMRMDINHGMI
jgi:hypothetical protein